MSVFLFHILSLPYSGLVFSVHQFVALPMMADPPPSGRYVWSARLAPFDVNHGLYKSNVLCTTH